MSADAVQPALVLVVDDTPSNLLVVGEALKDGYRVATAQSGEAALEWLARGERPDLILLDIMMPGLSGYDVLRRLRQDGATQDIPVIFLTADTSQAAEAEGLALGADDYVTKPVVFALLQARVRTVVQREQLKRAQIDALHNQLAERARLESLGKMVATFAHDIGGAIGICTGTVSGLESALKQLRADFAANTLRRSGLEAFLNLSSQAIELTARNLERAGGMLGGFKQQALDQSSDQARAVALKPWLADQLLMLSPLFAGTRHRCECQASEGLQLHTQPGPLGQVLGNLVGNAVLHAFDEDTAGCVRVHAEAEAGGVRLSVADDGMGMAPEVQARAFDPFFTTKRGRGGTGLGLDIVRHMVEQTLGGRLELHTAPGQGTQVVMHLPDLA